MFLTFLYLNSKRPYKSSGKEKEKESHCLAVTYSTKREIKTFHVVVEQRRQRNVQESVLHVQSRSRSRHRRRCLNLLIYFLIQCVTMQKGASDVAYNQGF